jgi:hypothetical protein
MSLRRLPVRIAVVGVLALGGAAGGVSLVGSAGAAGPDVGCGVGNQTVVLDLWANGRQSPLVGDPNWGVTSRTHTLANPVTPGRYRVFAVSEDNLSAEGQLHEQWGVEIGGVRTANTPDIPDDAIWYAQTALPDDDGDLVTIPAAVTAQLPGFDLGLVVLSAPATELSTVHIEHDGQLAPWSPNSVNARFVTLVCEPEPTTTQPTTTQPTTTEPAPTTSTTAETTTTTAETTTSTDDTTTTTADTGDTTVTTDDSTTTTAETTTTTAETTTSSDETTTTAETTTSSDETTTTAETTSSSDETTTSDGVGSAGVGAAQAKARDSGGGGLAFTGLNVATMAFVGLVLIATGTALVRRHRGTPMS